MIFKLLLIPVFYLTFTFMAFAQKLEAENAILSGGAEKQALDGASNGYIVAMKEGALTFDLHLPQDSYYAIRIFAAAPHGEKTNLLSINGKSIEFYLPKNNQYQLINISDGLKLAAGDYQLKLLKSWGWIDIDYLLIEPTTGRPEFNINKTLVTPEPHPNASKLYQFLYDNYGKKIISGVMTGKSMDEVNWLKAKTGREPALLGLDFMHCGRNYDWYNDEEPVNDAKKYYQRNGIPAFCWHWRDPSRSTEAFYSNETNFDISKIFEENSAEYKAMMKDIDYIAVLLTKLQNQGVPVLWRPLHEASGGWFWWGAKGAAPCKKLYQIMFNRLVNHHGLKNLIWVWTTQGNDPEWYPGDEYVDIIGRDIYKDSDHGSQILEFNKISSDYGGKKMVALSECGSFPDAENLVQDSAAWSYFMPWYGKFVRDANYNSIALWKKMLTHDYVITLDEMPDLRTYTALAKTHTPNPDHEIMISPTCTSQSINIESSTTIGKIALYSVSGILLKSCVFNSRRAEIPISELKPGIYIVKPNWGKSVKIIKM